MAIPAEVQEVIRLAAIQETEETRLQAMRDAKAKHQADIVLLNDQIASQVPVVQAARAALKSAAALL